MDSQSCVSSSYGGYWLSHSLKPTVEAETKLLSPEGLDCCDLVSRAEVLHGCRILQSKMDFKKCKRHTTGDYTRKGRLVALGNLEAPDLDRELFSPTINNKTTNLMFVLAAQHGLKIRGLDVYGAFITASIDSPVYL